MVKKLIIDTDAVKAKFAAIASAALKHGKTIITKPITDNVSVHCRIKECKYLPE